MGWDVLIAHSNATQQGLRGAHGLALTEASGLVWAKSCTRLPAWNDPPPPTPLHTHARLHACTMHTCSSSTSVLSWSITQRRPSKRPRSRVTSTKGLSTVVSICVWVRGVGGGGGEGDGESLESLGTALARQIGSNTKHVHLSICVCSGRICVLMRDPAHLLSSQLHLPLHAWPSHHAQGPTQLPTHLERLYHVGLRLAAGGASGQGQQHFQSLLLVGGGGERVGVDLGLACVCVYFFLGGGVGGQWGIQRQQCTWGCALLGSSAHGDVPY
jgi:hypothetical protein